MSDFMPTSDLLYVWPRSGEWQITAGDSGDGNFINWMLSAGQSTQISRASWKRVNEIAPRDWDSDDWDLDGWDTEQWESARWIIDWSDSADWAAPTDEGSFVLVLDWNGGDPTRAWISFAEWQSEVANAKSA